MNELVFANKVVLANGLRITNGQPLALPILTSNPVSPTNGDMYYNSVENVAKIYQNGTWEALAISGGITSYFVNKLTLSSLDIANKFVTLTSSPTSSSDTILNVVGGITQEYSVDFTVSGAILSWSGLGLESILAEGDRLIIQFN